MSRLSPPLLVYDRIEANVRRSRLLVIVFALSSLPVLAVLVPYLAEFFLIAIGVLAASALDAPGPGSDAPEEDLVLLFGLSLAAGALALAGIAYLLLRLASALVLRVSGARPVSPDEQTLLHRIVESLCIGAGLPVPSLYILESEAPNLFSTGLDPEHASLVLTHGLLELLEPRELEGVIAHELVQIGNHDTRLGTVLAAGLALIRLPFSIATGFFRILFRIHPVLGWGAVLYLGLPTAVSLPASFVMAKALYDDGETLQALMMVTLLLLFFYVFVLAPLLGPLLLRAISRERVHLADADAVRLTRNPAAYARALSKIEGAGQRDIAVNPALAALYFVDPRATAPWWDRMLATHPPPAERLDVITRMASFPPSEIEQAREAGLRFSQERNFAATPATPDSPAGERGTNWPSTLPLYAGAFRIGPEGAVVFSEARVSAPPIARLNSGDLVVILSDEGDFLFVLTETDQRGFILRSGAGEPVEVQRSASPS